MIFGLGSLRGRQATLKRVTRARLDGANRYARVRTRIACVLKGIDELAESLLHLRSNASWSGDHRAGLGRRLNGFIAEPIGDTRERIEGRLKTSQRRAERGCSARGVRCGAQRSGAGQQPGCLLEQRVSRVTPSRGRVPDARVGMVRRQR
jgi:hypothetical protein